MCNCVLQAVPDNVLDHAGGQCELKCVCVSVCAWSGGGVCVVHPVSDEVFEDVIL